ncbi:pre-mRNA-splicing factor cwc22 [Ceratocystis pirilliformis]|uniref:Pre-mRNA-splicing factor cwc22 n=1 Tax=Ceratocystis pirilliformis TaxID=259994 RepID=A0ABR3YLB2_9PEZI
MAPRSSSSDFKSRSPHRSKSRSRSLTTQSPHKANTTSPARSRASKSVSRSPSRGRSRSRSQPSDLPSENKRSPTVSRSRSRANTRHNARSQSPSRGPSLALHQSPKPLLATSTSEQIEKAEATKQADLKAEYHRLMDLRSGGTYIPPARLRALQAQMGQDDSDEGKRIQQKFHWEALKKAINGLINKCNVSNIKYIVPELFEENLVRGRGLFCRSLMKAQSASLGFTPVFAVLCSAVNSRLPQVGELLVSRLILQFRKAFRRNDKKVCLASTTFLAHLTNQQVVHEFLALQILLLLLNKPTDDSVEIAVGFMKEVGEFLSDMQPRPVMLVWDRFREILHEGEIDKRVQYAVEVLFQIRKDNFKDNPAVKEELDIIEEEDMITHKLSLDDEDLKSQDTLNIFKYDPNFEASEAAYKRLKAEILGEASGSDDESGDDDSDEDDSSDEDEEKKIEIQDQSNADLVNLRRTIYLTIKSSMDPEEAVHKLIRVKIPVGFEHELPSMIMECCAQEHTYQKFFGLIGERFAKLNRTWTDLFEKQFATTYETIHRFETNRLRNVARFFGHMFAFDGLGWHIFSVIHLNEDKTTSSSRIFIKILFQDIAEIIGMKKLRERLSDPQMQQYYEGIFPRDTPRNVRFSINYFTSIGMGVLTEEMREYLLNMPKPSLPAPPTGDQSDSESVSSYSSWSSRSRSRSRSVTPRKSSRGKSRSRSESYDSRSPSRSSSRSHSLSRSRSPAQRRARSYSRSVSRSRPPLVSKTRGSRRGRSITRSPEPRHQRARARRNSSSISRSPSVEPRASRRRRNSSFSRSRSCSRSVSQSSSTRSKSRSRSSIPPRRRSGNLTGAKRHASPYSRSPSPVKSKATGKRRRTPSLSRSPSPPPIKRGRR